MLCNTKVCSLIIALSKMIDSRIRTPAPIFTLAPIDTFGPNCIEIYLNCLSTP